MTEPRSYAILPLESSNRVYAAMAGELLVAELCALGTSMHAALDVVDVSSFGGVEYVVFDSEPLDGHDRQIISNLSATRAIYEIQSDDALRPLDHDRTEHFETDLVTIQRYSGKTNEQFTHLVVNLAVSASGAAAERSSAGKAIRLLDPVAGRGTTLNRGLIAGYDVAGIERVAADVDQYRTFLKTYLKDHRIKHTNDTEKIRKGPLAGTERWSIEIARSQRVEMVRGEAERVADYFAARSFDVIVGDLPYGVQHRAASGRSSSRSALELVEHAAPGWHSVLRGGGAVGLSWNLKTLARADLCACLDGAGFDVVEHPRSFEHVVDRSITRDVIVARRR